MPDPDKVLDDLKKFYAELTPEEYDEHLRWANPGLDTSFEEKVPRGRKPHIILFTTFKNLRLSIVACGIILLAATGLFLNYFFQMVVAQQDIISTQKELINDLSAWPLVSLETYEKMQDIADRLGVSTERLMANIEKLEEQAKRVERGPEATMGIARGRLPVSEVLLQKQEVQNIEEEIEMIKNGLHEFKESFIPASLQK